MSASDILSVQILSYPLIAELAYDVSIKRLQKQWFSNFYHNKLRNRQPPGFELTALGFAGPTIKSGFLKTQLPFIE